MPLNNHGRAWLEQQLSEVRNLQQRVRSVILDDSLDELEQLTDEKRCRLAGIDPLRVAADCREELAGGLADILQEEHRLEQLVSDRLMLMRNQIRKSSEAGRALRGYAAGTGRQRDIGSASRDISG
ncbi:hypothetical protein KDL44_15355 [bacterium]|nr:hypothetical protein [bacterium]